MLIRAGATMKNKSDTNKQQVEKKVMEAICQIPAESPLARQINEYGEFAIPQIVDEILKSKEENA